jgi:hypothetical protein
MSGVLWLIIVLFTSIIGLIIYLVVRKDKPVMPAYGAPPQQYGQYPPPPPPPAYQQPPPPAYQQQPAYQQPPAQGGEMRVCMGCGRQVPVNYNVCPHCGKPRQ